MVGRLIAVVGPSGVGKDSVMTALADAHPRLGLVKRVITRAPELGGEDYTAATEQEFAAQKARGDFALNWTAHGLLYGIPTAVQNDLENGRDLLVNLSRAVLPQAGARFPTLVTLLVTARLETLAARLAARGRESESDIHNRLARAEWPMPQGVDYIEISNDGALEDTLAQALSILYPQEALS